MKPNLNLFKAFALTCIAAVTAPILPAQAQTNLTTPTQWTYVTNVSVATVTGVVNSGYRIVDIEVESESPLLFSASFVRNLGDYSKGWWWLNGATSAEVDALMAQNNARLIDVEPYQTGFGLRFAAVFIANTGDDFASDHGWNYSRTASDIFAWTGSNPTRRIIDLQVYPVGNDVRYSYIWVTNTGTHQSPWWYLIGTSMSAINNFMAQNNARLIDLERNDNGGWLTAVMVPDDGKSTYHSIGLTTPQLTQYVNQFASRIIDFERYEAPAGSRFNVIMRQNVDDLSIDANEAMREHIPLGVFSGLKLQRLDGQFFSDAGIYESRIFEPATLISTAHLYTALRRVFLGFEDLSSIVTVFTGLSGGCPDGTAPVNHSVSSTLGRMMETNSNVDTEAIRARYGTSNILFHAGSGGATDLKLNHVVGCFCGSPRNEMTLTGLAALHRSVVFGELGDWRESFHELMLNDSDFGAGSFDTTAIMNAEIAAANLGALEETAFRDGLSFAHKSGQYTCFTAQEYHRSVGAYVRVPYRDGCDTTFREYFIGAWVNDATSGFAANNALGAGTAALWTHVLREALDTWESANCSPFESYCPGVPNSTNFPGVINAVGSSYISLNNLGMFADDLPQNVFTFMLVGTNDDIVMNPGGSLGNLCVGGAIGRYWSSLQSTGPGGTAGHPVNLQAIPKPNSGAVPVQAGETLRFQWWHRDTVNGLPASNFTNAMRITFI